MLSDEVNSLVTLHRGQFSEMMLSDKVRSLVFRKFSETMLSDEWEFTCDVRREQFSEMMSDEVSSLVTLHRGQFLEMMRGSSFVTLHR